MLEEIKDLNEQFFELYGRIRKNTENLSRKQYDFMQEKLFEQYKREFAKVELAKDTEDKGILTALKLRFGGYAPFKFLFFKNVAFKLLREQINKELNEYFEKQFNVLNENVPEETTPGETNEELTVSEPCENKK